MLVRWTIWGAVVGLLLAIVVGYAVVWYEDQWPVQQSKTASHAIWNFTRMVGAPAGFILGGACGAAIAVFRNRRRTRLTGGMT